MSRVLTIGYLSSLGFATHATAQEPVPIGPPSPAGQVEEQESKPIQYRWLFSGQFNYPFGGAATGLERTFRQAGYGDRTIGSLIWDSHETPVSNKDSGGSASFRFQATHAWSAALILSSSRQVTSGYSLLRGSIVVEQQLTSVGIIAARRFEVRRGQFEFGLEFRLAGASEAGPYEPLDAEGIEHQIPKSEPSFTDVLFQVGIGVRF